MKTGPKPTCVVYSKSANAHFLVANGDLSPSANLATKKASFVTETYLYDGNFSPYA